MQPQVAGKDGCEMFCAQCGKDIPETSDFCRFCGKPTTVAGAKAPETPTEASIPPPPPPGGGAPLAPGMTPTAPMPVMQPPVGGPAGTKKKWLLPLLVVLGVLIVGTAVTLGLVFGLKGGSATSGPEKTAANFFKAVDDQNVDAILATFDPAFVRDIRSEYGSSYKDEVDDYFFLSSPEARFSGLEYRTTLDGNSATVTVVAGTVSYLDEDGERVTEQITVSDDFALELIKQGDQWFIDESTFPDLLY